MPRHTFTPEQRQRAIDARRANPKEPLVHYTIRLRQATKTALLAAGTARVKRLLDEFAKGKRL